MKALHYDDEGWLAMFIFKFLSFLTGTVQLLVSGHGLEKFINMATGRGILLWDIQRLDENKILISVRLSAVHPLRHIARSTGCKFHCQDRKGLPFLWLKICRRKSLLIGAAIFFIGLYLLSSLVWSVEVQGNKEVSKQQILQTAETAGLKKWIFMWTIEPTEIETAIQDKIDTLSWVGVVKKGTKVMIQVAEKVSPPEQDEHPAHIVATKSGLVKEVLVLSGNPLVQEGDTVTPGQILISGIILPPELPLEQEQIPEDENQEKIVEGEKTIVHAKGLVRARVWYEGYGEALLHEEGIRSTGEYISRVCMKIGDKEIMLKGPKTIPAGYEQQERQVKKPLQWRNLAAPVELITEKYLRMENFTEDRTLAQAKSLAKERAMQEIAQKMPKNAQVLVQEDKDLQVKNAEGLVRIKVFVEALEEIGKEKKFEPNEAGY